LNEEAKTFAFRKNCFLISAAFMVTHIRASPEERKQFFFEKKNQKTFVLIALTLPHRAHH
jgi:hypothetical protein